MEEYAYAKDWRDLDRVQRFLTTVDERITEPLDDLESLRYISTFVQVLEEDLRLVQEVQGLWVMRMLDEKRYKSATISRALNTNSGQVAVTRIKGKYGETFERVKQGEASDATRLIQDTIAMGEKIANDETMPERVREAHRRKLVLLRSMWDRLFAEH